MIITLLSDFGNRDPYVGVMKGVIKGIAPGADLIDLTHEIPAQDVAAGAFALKSAFRYFPAGTVHLAVVDPGVGGARRPVAAQIGDFLYVCPDNGLLSYVLGEDTLKQAVTLNHTQYHRPTVSRTFHGRDIFAPVAAHLSLGVPLGAVGTALDTLAACPLARPRVLEDAIVCHVLSIDVYGNALTDLTEDVYNTWDASGAQVRAGGQDIPGPVSAYSSVPPGMPLALFSSAGHLEIAVRDGSARKALGLHVGDTVELGRKSEAAE